ncbi:hypothetical protein [Parvibaculum sp.]|uniref:hypothetical protein n=1 Tax=Parvibaculum sp. TaxID=2024848 RepID=UPI001DECC1F6|nr:hypothetical protein [Parvibaculum sp.]MBX3489803.1 hypothetical protein [Parvibaculum sp.]MCW5726211.1 hypothetical protein [Parvibaculum sp.]
MTDLFLIASGLLGIATGIGHSLLGERNVLRPLFAEDASAVLRKGRMRELLRGVWHLPSLTWIVLGLALVQSGLAGNGSAIAATAGTIFVLSGLANWMVLKSFHIGGAMAVATGCLAFAAVLTGA